MMLFQTFVIASLSLPALITAMRSFPPQVVTARLPTLHRRPAQRTALKVSAVQEPSHTFKPKSRAPVFSPSAYPQLQQLVNGNYHYAIGYVSNGLSTGFPGSLGAVSGRKNAESMNAANEFAAVAAYSSNISCIAIRQLVEADGMIYHETLASKELKRPMGHFFAAMTPKRNATTFAKLSRENFPWFPPVFMRLDQGGLWSKKEGMSAPIQIQNSKFDNIDETIEVLLNTAHEQNTKFEYDFCGFFEVPETIQDAFNRSEGSNSI